MKVQSAVQQQLTGSHGTLGYMLSDCDPELLNKTLPDASIGSIASIYAHAVFAEDVFVHTRFQDGQPLYLSGGWEEKTGVPFPGIPPAITPEWAQALKLDLSTFQQYADAVFTATDAYLANVPDSELERTIKGAMGEYTLGWGIAILLGQHAAQHSGEIAALKGVQGLKGLPF
ncbi:MAG: DinB family protein [Dehalococcoidia bacterium]